MSPARGKPRGFRPRGRPSGGNPRSADAPRRARGQRQHRRARRRFRQQAARSQSRDAARARVDDEGAADLGRARPARPGLCLEDARPGGRARGQGRAQGQPVPAGRRRPAAHDRALVALRERPPADWIARHRGRHRRRPDAVHGARRAARGLRRQVLAHLQRPARRPARQLAVVRFHDPAVRRWQWHRPQHPAVPGGPRRGEPRDAREWPLRRTQQPGVVCDRAGQAGSRRRHRTPVRELRPAVAAARDHGPGAVRLRHFRHAVARRRAASSAAACCARRHRRPHGSS